MSESPAAAERISALLRGVTWLEVAVLLVAGLGLLVANPSIVGIWPWTLAPFNLRFLGALYTAALIAAFLQALIARWAPARTITWMIFVFTLVVTALSFIHLGRFDLQGAPAWIWFILYLGVCANAGLHLAHYRHRAPSGAAPSGVWRGALRLQAIVLGAGGAVLLFMPEWSALLWPWKLDRFHAQIYSVVFLTPATAALCLHRAATRVDWLAIGLTQVAWGLLPVLALVLVDLQQRRVMWGSAPVWIWLGLMLLTAALGVAMLVRGARR